MPYSQRLSRLYYLYVINIIEKNGSSIEKDGSTDMPYSQRLYRLYYLLIPFLKM